MDNKTVTDAYIEGMLEQVKLIDKNKKVEAIEKFIKGLVKKNPSLANTKLDGIPDKTINDLINELPDNLNLDDELLDKLYIGCCMGSMIETLSKVQNDLLGNKEINV